MNFIQKALEDKIKQAAQDYYTTGTSELSDEEFDNLVEELRKLAPNSSVLNQTGWGYSVNADTTPGHKFKHKYREVGSLTKAYNVADIKSELKNYSVEISLKLDGLSVVMYYSSGNLTNIVTRGDGFTGIDVTNRIQTCVPNKLHDNFSGAIRGELIMKAEDWCNYKSMHPAAKNSRNSVAGILSADSVSSKDIECLSVVVYEIVGSDNPLPYYSLSSIARYLSTDFETVPSVCIGSNTMIKYPLTEEYLAKLRSDFCQDVLPNDGLVIKYAVATHDVLSNAIIYEAQAFKFKAETAVTEVEDIEWNLTKTRYLVPKAKLKTVELSGTSVTYATCFNAKFVQDNLLGPGATVEVEKHGEIIPNINKVISTGRLSMPEVCPECGTKLEYAGVHLQCPNEDCNNARVQDLIVWLTFLADVDGIKDKIALKLLKTFVDELSIESVMNLKDSKVIWKDAKAGHKLLLVTMLDKLFNAPINITNALQALNIPRLGEKTSQKLAMYPELIESLLNRTQNYEEMCSKIGTANSESIINNLDKFDRLNLIKDRIVTEPLLNTDENIKVAITGKLSVPRKQLEKELQSYGFSSGEISKNTKYLIIDDLNSTSSKNKFAIANNIERLSEMEFRKRFFTK